MTLLTEKIFCAKDGRQNALYSLHLQPLLLVWKFLVFKEIERVVEVQVQLFVNYKYTKLQIQMEVSTTKSRTDQ